MELSQDDSYVINYATYQDLPTGHHLRLLSLQKPPEESWKVLVYSPFSTTPVQASPSPIAFGYGKTAAGVERRRRTSLPSRTPSGLDQQATCHHGLQTISNDVSNPSIPGVSKYLRKWVQVPVFIGSCPIF